MAGGLAAAKEAGFRNNAVVDSQRLGRLPHRNIVWSVWSGATVAMNSLDGKGKDVLKLFL